MTLRAFNRPAPMRNTLRALARLVDYPDAALRAHLPTLKDALHAERVLATARLGELDALIAAIGSQDALVAEADYVQLFDSGRSTSLHLFEHVHGDSRDRGPAMVDLAQSYAKAGLVLAPNQLPDYLPVVVEFASTQPPREARALLAETAHILNAIFDALGRRRSRYAAVLGALLDLAGEPARAVTPVADEPVDATWAEPPAFDGCSARGQSRPAAPQPLHFVRTPPPARGALP